MTARARLDRALTALLLIGLFLLAAYIDRPELFQ
jgi:hypothetical protein